MKEGAMNEQETLQEIKQELERVKTLLEELPTTVDLKLKVYDERVNVANHRIADLEEANKWLRRAIVGAIIVGVVAMYFK